MKVATIISAVAIFTAGCKSATVNTGEVAIASAQASSATIVTTNYTPMKIFEPMVGKTWRGDGTGPGGEPIVDIANHEFILGGKAFQSTHKLENSSYGGRTIFFYDESAEKYVFHYFTTAGFHTTGAVEPTETGFTAIEKVNGHESIVEVRSTVIFDGDIVGEVMRVKANYIDKNGKTAEGGERLYRPAEQTFLLFDEADALFNDAPE